MRTNVITNSKVELIKASYATLLYFITIGVSSLFVNGNDMMPDQYKFIFMFQNKIGRGLFRRRQSFFVMPIRHTVKSERTIYQFFRF